MKTISKVTPSVLKWIKPFATSPYVRPFLFALGIGGTSYVVRKSATAAFRRSEKYLNYTNTVINHLRSLEIGGGLGPGYISTGAATERQAAISAMQGSIFTNRRFLGKEAKLRG